MLLPQDLYVLLKLTVIGNANWTFQSIADELSTSASQIHTGLKGAKISGLYNWNQRTVVTAALSEFIIHGMRYSFPVEPGNVTRGMPTSFAASPLNKKIVTSSDVIIPVWSDPEGTIKGYRIEPLHCSAVDASKRDNDFYQLLALVDAIREGGARERKLASKEIQKRISGKKSAKRK